MPTTTPILGLTVPTVGGDVGVWGAEINGDLTILDSLGAAPQSVLTGNAAVIGGVFPELIVRVTTGAVNQTTTLPAPSVANTGKIFTIKKIDSGAGSVTIVPTGSTIDGQTSWILAAQYAHIRLYCNGASYDVIG
jgi:hypothetical protein